MLSGKDRGKKGKVARVFLGEDKLIVESLNMVKKHQRARKQGQKGQIVNKERAINASSVALVCKSCGKQTRIGFKIDGDVKTRICRKCQAEV